jgi:hypothetical protein
VSGVGGNILTKGVTMSEDKTKKSYGSAQSYLGRNLENYKKLQSSIAEKKKLVKELKEADTLTKARKLLYGLKKGNLK